MRKQLIGSLFAFAMAGQLWGQGLYEKYERMLTLPEGYVCYRVDGKIKVDGKLNEADWQKAQSTSSFVDISGEGFAKPCYDTSAKMLWDDNCLYVGDCDKWFASECYSAYQNKYPGVLGFLGIRNEAYGSGAAHHNGKFDIDESGFWLGVCAEAAFAFEK